MASHLRQKGQLKYVQRGKNYHRDSGWGAAVASESFSNLARRQLGGDVLSGRNFDARRGLFTEICSVTSEITIAAALSRGKGPFAHIVHVRARRRAGITRRPDFGPGRPENCMIPAGIIIFHRLTRNPARRAFMLSESQFQGWNKRAGAGACSLVAVFLSICDFGSDRGELDCIL